MKKIFYVLVFSALFALSALSCVWLYYNIRYQIVYIQSIPFEYDRWEKTVTMVLPKEKPKPSAEVFLEPAPPPAK